MMKKISVYLSGHTTSVSLEPEFADALHKLAAMHNRPVASIISEIDSRRAPGTNLSAAVRVWILKQFMG